VISRKVGTISSNTDYKMSRVRLDRGRVVTLSVGGGDEMFVVRTRKRRMKEKDLISHEKEKRDRDGYDTTSKKEKEKDTIPKRREENFSTTHARGSHRQKISSLSTQCCRLEDSF